MIVGIVGGGQLARMLALSGQPLGLEFVFLDPDPNPSARGLGRQLRGPFDDMRRLAELADGCDVVTYEFENVPTETVAFLSQQTTVHPSAQALAIARDRLHEKTLFGDLGIPTVPYRAVDNRADLDAAWAMIGPPAVLKTRTLGYDGKGQAVCRSTEDLERAWQRLGGMPLILEDFIDFDREVSVIVVRGRDGETRFYPLAENCHRDGVLALSVSRPQDPVAPLAQDYAQRLLDALAYVGVLALELFQVGERLLANEMAPRVHNSGHWTIECAETSQFENHLRAILGWPLGSTAAWGRAAMANCIGTLPDRQAILAIPGAHVHVYNKAVRAGRKVGHVTVRAADTAALEAALSQLRLVL